MNPEIRQKITELINSTRSNMDSISIDPPPCGKYVPLSSLQAIRNKIYLKGILKGLERSLKIIDEEESEEQK